MFHGSMVALVTPMTSTGDIDYEAFESLLEWHIESGTDAILVGGTTGESGTLTHAEHTGLIRRAVAVVNERLPVIAGTGHNGTQQTIEATQVAMDEGVDACLVMTPAYIRPTQEGLYQHYHALVGAVAVPIIMYNIPVRTACDLLPETLARLKGLSNLIGIKEASGSLDRLKAIQSLCGDALDVYSGDDLTAKAFMLAGAKGVISVAANIIPREIHEMAQAAHESDKARADQLDDQLCSLYQALALEQNPIACKWALHEMGKIGDTIRLPLTPLSESHRPALRAVLAEKGLVG